MTNEAYRADTGPSSLHTIWLIATGTIRRKRISLLAFAVGTAFFHALIAISFPAIGGMAAVERVIQTFPDGLRTLLRVAPSLQAGFGLRDYLSFSWFHPVFLGLGAAFVVSRAADALAGEIERGSIYFVLSRPIQRWHLVVGKMAEMLVSAGLIVAAGWLGLTLGIYWTLPGEIDPFAYLPVAVTVWLLFAALGSGAFVISALCRSGGTAAGWGSAWTLLAFVFDVVPATAYSLLGRLNPWHHYYPQEIIALGQLDPSAVLMLAGWVALGGLLCTILFGRRDLA